MAKKPKVVHDIKMPGLVSAEQIRAAVTRTSTEAGTSAYAKAMQDVDPVILALRRSFGRYKLELKLTKKPEKPLSRG